MPTDAPVDATGEAAARLWRGRFWVLAAYVLAAVLALVVVRVVAPSDPWIASWWVHATMTLAVFAASVRFDNTSLYDPYWSVVPGGIMVSWVVFADTPADPVRATLLAAVVLAWSIRLTANWAIGWPGLHHEDWRYVQFRDGGTLRYWAISLFGLQGFPTVLVALGSWPAWRALSTPGAPWNLMDLIALAVGLGSVWLEHVADSQARDFRRARTDPAAVLRTGVWAWSRHPNYLGEIGFWTSMFLFSLGAAWSNALTVVAPAAMVALFRFVSIPMMERRQLARKPGYASLMAEVPMLWPRAPSSRYGAAPSPPPADPANADTWVNEGTARMGPIDLPGEVSPASPTLVVDEEDPERASEEPPRDGA